MGDPANCQHASTGPAQRGRSILAMVSELDVVALLLMDAGTVLAPTDVADTA